MHKIPASLKHASICLPIALVAGLCLANFSDAEPNEVASAKLPTPKLSSTTILQRMHPKPCKLPNGQFYVPATVSTIRWGILPNSESKPILTVPSKSLITFDTLSSEGMVEDQGRDPVKFFGKFGVRPNEILKEAIEICASDIEHNMTSDGPHIIIGPVAVEGA